MSSEVTKWSLKKWKCVLSESFWHFSGSADRTVKFWDLETFELIGSSGPEVLQVFSLNQARFAYEIHNSKTTNYVSSIV